MLEGEETGEVFCAEIVSSGRLTIPRLVRKKLSLNEGTMVRVRIWKDKEEEVELSKVGTKERFVRR
jgi:bifunctional DNA-binding transcriptional regulator/antitoxin component of YhaV-PrlF toxin-antitoxin module